MTLTKPSLGRLEKVDLRNRKAWQAHAQWFQNKLEALKRVFGPIVKSPSLGTEEAL